MKKSEYYLEKADLVVSDISTNGGFLQPAQAARFIRLLIKEAKLLKEANVVPMRSHQQLIETMRFGSRVLVAGSEGVALSEGQRARPDFTKVTLNVKLFKAEARWSDEVIEDNIERGALADTIMTQLAERASLDIDEVLALGDTASADTFLAQFNGLIKTVVTNVFAKSPIGTLTKDDFTDILKLMPVEFQRDFPRMRWLTSANAVHNYRRSLSDRATVLGDRNVEAFIVTNPLGVPLVDVPVFPENLGAGTNETAVILTLPDNMNVGFWRQIRLQTARDVSAGQFVVVLSLRMDFKLTHEPASVKATGIKV